MRIPSRYLVRRGKGELEKRIAHEGLKGNILAVEAMDKMTSTRSRRKFASVFQPRLRLIIDFGGCFGVVFGIVAIVGIGLNVIKLRRAANRQETV